MLKKLKRLSAILLVFTMLMSLGSAVAAEKANSAESNSSETAAAESGSKEKSKTPSGKEAGEALSLKIFHFNDTHAREGESSVDFARVAGKVNELRNKHENVLLFDAGDTLHGRPIANLFSGFSIAMIRNTMGIDAAVPGNHDFNYGYKRLLQLIGYCEYPWLTENITLTDTGENLLKGSMIRVFDGYKIGIFGLATPETMFKSHPDNVKGLDFIDPIAASEKAVKRLLASGCDYIICIGHIGTDGGTEVTSIDICNKIPEIDLFIDGHSHDAWNSGYQTSNGIIASTGEYLGNVGYVEVKVTSEGDKRTRATIYDGDETSNWPIMTQTRSIIKLYEEAVDEITQQVVGKTEVELIGEREIVRKTDSNLGRLIVDAILESTGADVALNNGGNVRATIPVGDITYGDLLEVMPFGNIIVTMDIKGSEILAALEQGVSVYPETNGGFLHIAGGTYVFDPDKPAGERIVEVYINGKLIDPDATYTVATNDFLAAGGDESPLGNGQIKAQTDPMDEIVLEYIKKHGVVPNAIDVGRILHLGETAG